MTMSLFKNESPDEARDRLKKMSEDEKKGFAAASEGQLQPARDEILDQRAAQVDDENEARFQARNNPGGDGLAEAYAARDAGDTPNKALNARKRQYKTK